MRTGAPRATRFMEKGPKFNIAPTASTSPRTNAGRDAIAPSDLDELDVDALGGEEAEIGGDEERRRGKERRRHQLDPGAWRRGPGLFSDWPRRMPQKTTAERHATAGEGV